MVSENVKSSDFETNSSQSCSLINTEVKKWKQDPCTNAARCCSSLPTNSLLWPVCTFIHHVIMCRPWIRQLLAKADSVITTRLESKITTVWSSCCQHSAYPQWFACVGSGVGEFCLQILSPFSSPAIVSAAHSCAAESWPSACVITGLNGKRGYEVFNYVFSCVFILEWKNIYK